MTEWFFMAEADTGFKFLKPACLQVSILTAVQDRTEKGVHC